MITQNIDRIVTRADFKTSRVLVTSIFPTIQGEGPYSGVPCVFVRLAGCNFGDKSPERACLFCFPTDHQIYTPTGKKTFGEVKLGDELYCLDEDGKLTTTKVKKVMSREVATEDLLELTFDVDGKIRTIICTKEHPIHTSNRGFVQAGDLKRSDKVVHTQIDEIYHDALKRRMRASNPMFNRATVDRVMKTIRQGLDSGRIVIKRTPEQKLRYSLSKMGDKNPMKRHEVRLASALAHNYKESGLERKFASLFSELKIKVKSTTKDKKYLGNNTVGFKLPDFKLSGNKLIEVYDTTFTYKKGNVTYKRTKANYEKPLKKFYNALGYDVLFLTQKDLPSYGKGSGNNVTREDLMELKEKVVAFSRNGAKLISKRTPSYTRKMLKDWKTSGKGQVVNFSCAPYNTFVVNDIHTHNCDTFFKLDQATEYDKLELAQILIDKMHEAGVDLLVITGGEPTLQINLIDVLWEIKNRYPSVHFQFETNGTQQFFAEAYPPELAACTTFIVSPKAIQKLGRYPEVSKAYKKFRSYLKFVVTTDKDDVHHTIPSWAFDWNSREGSLTTVYVSPMAVYKRAYTGEVSNAWDRDLIDAEATSANYAYAAEYVMRLARLFPAEQSRTSFKLSLQTHLFTAIP